jgi:hypothetical protein
VSVLSIVALVGNPRPASSRSVFEPRSLLALLPYLSSPFVLGKPYGLGLASHPCIPSPDTAQSEEWEVRRVSRAGSPLLVGIGHASPGYGGRQTGVTRALLEGCTGSLVVLDLYCAGTK